MNNDFQKQNQQWQNQGQNQPRPNQPTSTGFSAFDSIVPTQTTNGGQHATSNTFDWSMPPAPGGSMQGRPATQSSAAGGFSDPWNLSSVPAPAQVLRSSPVRAPVSTQAPIAGNKLF